MRTFCICIQQTDWAKDCLKKLKFTLFWVKASNRSQHYGMIFLCLKIENSFLELLSNVQRKENSKKSLRNSSDIFSKICKPAIVFVHILGQKLYADLVVEDILFKRER